MTDLNVEEIESVSGGESALAHDAIGVGIVLGGIGAANPAIVALGVLYLATD